VIMWKVWRVGSVRREKKKKGKNKKNEREIDCFGREISKSEREWLQNERLLS